MQLLALLTFLILGQANAGSWALQQEALPRFAVVPMAIASEGSGKVASLASLADSETLLDRLLGTNCYSTALASVKGECRSMDHEAKARLALGITSCHLQALGGRKLRCAPSTALQACTAGLSDREFSTFNEFFTNIDSMCLFIQNQDFQRSAEQVINQLHSSSAVAVERLAGIDIALAKQRSQLSSLQEAADDMAAQQRELEAAAGQTLQGLAQLQNETASVDSKLVRALQNEAQLLVRQSEALHGLEQLEAQEEQRAEQAATRWEAAHVHAETMLQHQQAHASMQQALLGDLRTLSADSATLRGSLETALMYQRRGNALLMHVLGRSYSGQDLAFLALSAAASLAAGATARLRGARLPLLLLLAGSLACERLALSWLGQMMHMTPAGQMLMTLPGPLGSTWSLEPRSAIRQAFGVLAAAVLLHAAWTYKDPQAGQSAMLRAMQRLELEQRAHQEANRRALEEHRMQLLQELMALASVDSRLRTPSLQCSSQPPQQPPDVRERSTTPVPMLSHRAQQQSCAHEVECAPLLDAPAAAADPWPEQQVPLTPSVFHPPPHRRHRSRTALRARAAECQDEKHVADSCGMVQAPRTSKRVRPAPEIQDVEAVASAKRQQTAASGARAGSQH